MRSGAASGGPKGRYVANLGHVQDDESGLIYMRARYYEPGTGRFISQDNVRQGFNWYSYCVNVPTSNVDASGNGTILDAIAAVGGLFGAMLIIGAAVILEVSVGPAGVIAAMQQLKVGLTILSLALALGTVPDAKYVGLSTVLIGGVAYDSASAAITVCSKYLVLMEQSGMAFQTGFKSSAKNCSPGGIFVFRLGYWIFDRHGTNRLEGRRKKCLQLFL